VAFDVHPVYVRGLTRIAFHSQGTRGRLFWKGFANPTTYLPNCIDAGTNHGLHMDLMDLFIFGQSASVALLREADLMPFL